MKRASVFGEANVRFVRNASAWTDYQVAGNHLFNDGQSNAQTSPPARVASMSFASNTICGQTL